MRKTLAILLALVMVLALCACGAEESSAPAAAPAAAAPAAAPGERVEVDAVVADDGTVHVNDGVDLSGKTIGYVTIFSGAPWGGLVGTSFAKYAEECGADVKSLDANQNPDQVVEYCRQMIDTGVDALAVFGGDVNAMADIAKECSEAGIPLFNLALDVAEAGRDYCTACIGPDQELMCYNIGKFVLDQNGADAGCLVVQINGVPFLEDYIERTAGFARAMEEGNYDVKEKVDAYSSRPDAKSFMEDFLNTYGDDIDIVMGYDDDLTMGAVQAIDEAGKTGTIKVYSLTGQNDALQAVADGQMELTVINRAQDIGAEAVNAVYEYFTTGSTAYYHRTPLTYVTTENVADWLGRGEF